MTPGPDGHARAHVEPGGRPTVRHSAPRRLRRAPRLIRRRDFAALCFALLLTYLLVGGHPSRPFEPLDRVFDRAVAATGLVIARVEISGLRHADEARIYDLIDATGAKTLFGFRPAELRATIVASRPWIRDVEIVRDWPDRLRLVVHEREPFAVLHAMRNGKPHADLIDAAGVALGPVPPHAPPPLPQVFGAGAAPHAAEIVGLSEAHPDIAAEVLYYEFVAGRRWSLHLRGGRTVHLPWSGASVALGQLSAQFDRPDVMAAKVIDLRRRGAISLRDGAPSAAQARAQSHAVPVRTAADGRG